jgi:hypothetical protein
VGPVTEEVVVVGGRVLNFLFLFCFSRLFLLSKLLFSCFSYDIFRGDLPSEFRVTLLDISRYRVDAGGAS